MSPGSGQKGYLTGAALKYIAMLSMVIDHIAASWIARNAAREWLLSSDIRVSMYYCMRCMGRLAFPIFAFCLVEGFVYTRNRLKHTLLLALFAALSQWPYHAVFYRAGTEPGFNTVFELLCCFVLLIVLEKLAHGKLSDSANKASENPEHKDSPGDLSLNARKSVLQDNERVSKLSISEKAAASAAVILFAVIAECARLDYGWGGIVLAAAYYFFRENRAAALSSGAAVLIIYMVLTGSMGFAVFVIPAFMLIYLYNGKRGRQPKLLFYLFYPGHLMLIYAVRVLVFGA